MSKHRSNSPIWNMPINNKAEPKVSVHSPVSYLIQNSGWKRMQEQEASDRLMEQIAQDSQ